MSVAELQKIEPTLNEKVAAELTVVKVTGTSEYELTSEVKQGTTKNKFTITRLANGEVARTCATAATGACPSTGKW
jgi:hypothetical protein